MTDGERITALEVTIKHVSDNQDRMAAQMQEVHDILLKAKGAKWAIIGLASLGGFLSAKLGSIAALFGLPIPK